MFAGGLGAGLAAWLLRVLLALVMLFSISAPATAQPRFDRAAREGLAWETPGRADVLSNVVIAAALASPCLIDRQLACLKQEAFNIGAAAWLALVAKRLVHRARPDNSDAKSFFSMHTAIACAATLHSRTVALCPTVGWLRVAADKHWLTDVSVGAAVGVGVTVRF